ncbi:dipeptidase [Alicyclobacillaceae bacterium I2511]|nr:dipeptidase [Alicyclobacillaceae bacterium I2511]
MEDLETYLQNHRQQQLDELMTFLRYPSISTLPENEKDVLQCAEFLAQHARSIGFEHVQLLPTPGHPVLYADWLHAPGKPTVLVYGHYDVQPVDPLELWKTPPFAPTIADGQIWARGASDDKGPVFVHFKAFESLLQTTGSLPVNVKLCIEGEEEIGSRHLPEVVEKNAALFAADVLVVSDTTMFQPGQPSVCYGLRGLAALQVNVFGANGDVHSGLYGGAIPNPIHALVSILSALHDEQGRVTVPGFYGDVETVAEDERKAMVSLSTGDEEMAKSLGISALFGESGYSTLERLWVRPTLEINGIYGGFQGAGTKTVIPSEAHAKITCRLVPNQEPQKIQQSVSAWLQQIAPPGVRVEVQLLDGSKPFLTPFHHPAIQLAAKAYEHAYGVPAVFTRMGGSIGIMEDFDRVLHIPSVLMGFSLDNDNFHAPNEHFALENFDKGLRALCYYWNNLADVLQA